MDSEDFVKAAIGAGATALGLKAIQMLFTKPCPCGGRRPKSPIRECKSCGQPLFAHTTKSNNFRRSLPKSYLDRWANPGASVTSKDTHHSIRGALSDHNMGRFGQTDYRVYLQGSYKNHTTVHGDSDVDVVVELESWFVPRDNFDIAVRAGEGLKGPAVDVWQEFRRKVLDAFRDRFGLLSGVEQGSKAIKVQGNSNRRDADVLVCLAYGRPGGSIPQGITFLNRETRTWIVNYPDQHYDNAVDKHSQDRSRRSYKHTVRMFKNCRSYLANHLRIDASIAPSYFIECMLYNVPDSRFVSDEVTTFYRCLEWLSTELAAGRADKWTAVNGIQQLFGPGSHQWETHDAMEFLNEVAKLWFHF